MFKKLSADSGLSGWKTLFGLEKNDFPFSIQICMPIYFAYNLHNIQYHNHFASYCKIQDQLLAFHSQDY